MFVEQPLALSGFDKNGKAVKGAGGPDRGRQVEGGPNGPQGGRLLSGGGGSRGEGGGEGMLADSLLANI